MIEVVDLRTFHLPELVTGSDRDRLLADKMIEAWQADGIFQVATEPRCRAGRPQDAIEASKRFFRLAAGRRRRSHVSDLTYSGYIASGEEVTAGEADYSEIFTVCKDIPLDDSAGRRAVALPRPGAVARRRVPATP